MKVYEVIIKKYSEIVKGKKRTISRFLALKAKKEYSDEESSTSGSENKEYAMTMRDFKKFFKIRAKENVLDAEIQITLSENVRSHQETKTKGILLEDPRAITMKKRKRRPKDKTCLMAQASNEARDEMVEREGLSEEEFMLGGGLKMRSMKMMMIRVKSKD
uniref:Transposase, Ptta/En/Spm, transposase, Tnp1/En/Spm-like protein n=1 Tax=Tanacetum cinerariifolium TaxID=118510 RepID=A0A699GR79_TANCI|nr:transposase, Ptta/En/Spm, transposase, Tnp1/En/Spm-like protein [Tanacetum cinerariifolium]